MREAHPPAGPLDTSDFDDDVTGHYPRTYVRILLALVLVTDLPVAVALWLAWRLWFG